MADEDSSRIVFSPNVGAWLQYVFHQVWNKLPVADRKQLTARVIHVTTQHDIPGTVESHYAGNLGLSAVRRGQQWIWLNRSGLVYLDDAWARFMVAHELAHMLLGHGDGYGADDIDEAEREADYRAQWWGFPRPKA